MFWLCNKNWKENFFINKVICQSDEIKGKIIKEQKINIVSEKERTRRGRGNEKKRIKIEELVTQNGINNAKNSQNGVLP